ncbi:scopoletin glucosyltransferase-like [Juglans microcarpa x Juglans regia]|uniref:scopoletin glucosyltransferase-like n=1 Tax=Juglans microcarpa x Juglans regia TaxID=2249226 RepID=UPI001B7E8DFA|nr:scopoletin glucosyltransferase-like [Juglans microcarpa x Juglans regia]
MSREIWAVPFFGQGHLLPTMELCKHIASRDFKTTLLISSNLSSSVPSSFRHVPLLHVLEIPSPPPPPPQPGSDPMHQHRRHHGNLALGLENLLSARAKSPNPELPVCAILDVMMSWSAEVFQKFNVPTVAFFTSGACSAAIEHAMWKAHPLDIQPGEVRLLPGLPENMALTQSDLKQRPHGPPGPPPPTGGAPPGRGADFHPPPGPGPKMMGPPKPGQQPPWVEEVKNTIALLINTCDDLERPFISYLTHQVGKPVWGVGPLLPQQYWQSSRSLLHDREIRTNRRSNVTEDEVIKWLESKPRASVLYVSFGSEVGPTMEEYPHLADALEASSRPFIWVIQPGAGRSGPPRQLLGNQPGSEEEEGYFPQGLDERVGDTGLIIRGWAPQLLILSHPSTGGFLSHCGWNSTVEAIGRGVPFLVWPIRGDQYYNGKLVAVHLKVGYMVSDDLSEPITKEDIGKGIEKLMGDEDVKERALLLSTEFQHGFPASSVAALDAFRDFIKQIVA